MITETLGNELCEGKLYNPPHRYSLFRNLLIACLFVLHEIETHPPTHILSLATEIGTLQR
jgi:hypothetical protein